MTSNLWISNSVTILLAVLTVKVMNMSHRKGNIEIMWFLKSTFGIITLQVGIISFSSVFITLAASILLVNALSLDTEEPMAWMIMFVFTFNMIIIWTIAFNGASKELPNLISIATVLWAIYFILWNVLVIWSFIQQNKNICIEARCPNALWLINNSWYELKHSANEKYKLSNYKGLELKRVKPLIEQMEANNGIISAFNETGMTSKNQRNLISSIIFTILYTSIFCLINYQNIQKKKKQNKNYGGILIYRFLNSAKSVFNKSFYIYVTTFEFKRIGHNVFVASLVLQNVFYYKLILRALVYKWNILNKSCTFKYYRLNMIFSVEKTSGVNSGLNSETYSVVIYCIKKNDFIEYIIFLTQIQIVFIAYKSTCSQMYGLQSHFVINFRQMVLSLLLFNFLSDTVRIQIDQCYPTDIIPNGCH
ncbi:hypothetical protein QTP88_017925 [Uroleucon formosanum]